MFQEHPKRNPIGTGAVFNLIDVLSLKRQKAILMHQRHTRSSRETFMSLFVFIGPLDTTHFAREVCANEFYFRIFGIRIGRPIRLGLI